MGGERKSKPRPSAGGLEINNQHREGSLKDFSNLNVRDPCHPGKGGKNPPQNRTLQEYQEVDFLCCIPQPTAPCAPKQTLTLADALIQVFNIIPNCTAEPGQRLMSDPFRLNRNEGQSCVVPPFKKKKNDTRKAQ